MPENQLVKRTTISPAEMLYAALEKGATTESMATLSQMLELQQKWEANEARKAWHSAMSSWKTKTPVITKTKEVDFTNSKGNRTHYFHADLADACKVISESMSPFGLSVTWKTKQIENKIEVTCYITHEFGHSEFTSLAGIPDESGGKNGLQAIGSTVSYLERYTLFALCGLAAHGQDDDGRGAGNPAQGKGDTGLKTLSYLSPEQVEEFKKIIGYKGIEEDRFLKYMGSESIDRIKASDYEKGAMALSKAKGTEVPKEE